jgi:hypothetical protein
MRITTLDDYFDTVRALPSFATLKGHEIQIVGQIVAYAPGSPINVVNPAVLSPVQSTTGGAPPK